VNAAVAEVVVTQEAVEAVVAVILDHTGAKRAVCIVATKLFTAPLQIFKNWVGKGLETKLNVIQPYPEYIKDLDSTLEHTFKPNVPIYHYLNIPAVLNQLFDYIFVNLFIVLFKQSNLERFD